MYLHSIIKSPLRLLFHKQNRLNSQRLPQKGIFCSPWAFFSSSYLHSLQLLNCTFSKANTRTTGCIPVLGWPKPGSVTKGGRALDTHFEGEQEWQPLLLPAHLPSLLQMPWPCCHCCASCGSYVSTEVTYSFKPCSSFFSLRYLTVIQTLYSTLQQKWMKCHMTCTKYIALLASFYTWVNQTTAI